MDLAATQIYEDQDFPSTQRISNISEEQESTQIGTLTIDLNKYQIKKGITKIGRLSRCGIVINDVTVSKIHAEIEASAGQESTWICDLHSSNKTKLNNLILRPGRSYELKDGSIIEFGRVRAIYHSYRPEDDIVIPETPAPTRQKITRTVIPNTPDSSLNNSSSMDESVILGTQKDDEKNTFRKPLIPQQRQSTSIDKKNTSGSSSVSDHDNSQISAMYVSNADVSHNEEITIFDMETQKFEEGRKTTIHNVETQKFPTDAPKLIEKDITSNMQDKLAKRDFIANIHDVETQNMDDNATNEQSQKSRLDTRDITAKKFTDIHDMETQNDINSIATDDIEIRKSETDRIKTQVKNIDQMEHNIHDLETQVDKMYSAEGIHDMETQFESNGSMNKNNNNTKNDINSIATDDIEIRKSEIDRTKTQVKNIDQMEHSIHDLETQVNKMYSAEGIHDMETQFESSGSVNKNNNNTKNDIEKYKDKDEDNILDNIKNDINHKNSTKSRSSSPASLNLSSSGIEEERPLSPLNESIHLLESSSLLEYFGEGLDKQEEIQASTPKLNSETHSTKKHTDNIRNMSNASDNEDSDDEDIFDALTQCVNRKSKISSSSDSEIDEENAITRHKSSKKKCITSQLPRQNNDDSETDAEEYIEEFVKKQRKSLEALNKSCNESAENRKEPGTSIESEDMFDMPTQQVKNRAAKEMANSSINQLEKTNKIVIDDVVPTQLIDNIKGIHDQGHRSDLSSTNDMKTNDNRLVLPRDASLKSVINSKDALLRNDEDNVDDTTATQIINTNMNTSESIDRRATLENLDCENINYEMAPTQVISEIEDEVRRKDVNCEKAAEPSKMDLNDTLERNLDEMFDGVNNDSIQEPPLMSTQNLEDILKSSQCDNNSHINKSTVVNNALIDNVPQTKSGKESSPNRFNKHNPSNSKANENYINKTEIDSQNLDVHLSSITTRRKRNIMTNTQELTCTMEKSCQDNANSLKKSKKGAEDNNITTKPNKKGKRTTKSKDESTVITDDSINKNTNETISNENNESNVQISKSMKQKDRSALEQVLDKDSTEFDTAKDLASISNVGAPCSSESGQRAQVSDTLYESDDDILTRLPAVRISGTLSNPPSPSVSSTSTASVKSKSERNAVKYKSKKTRFARGKYTLRKQVVEDSKKDDNLKGINNEPLIPLSGNNLSSSVPSTSRPEERSEVVTSSDSDSEISYKRFKQMADRMLNKELTHVKIQSKSNVQDTYKSIISNKSMLALPDVPKDSKQDFDIGRSKSPVRTSLRLTRYNRQSKDNSHILQTTHAENEIDRSTKCEAKLTSPNRSNTVEQDSKQKKLGKYKANQVIEERSVLTRNRRSTAKTIINRQSPNIIEYSAKTNSNANSPEIENTKSANRKITSKVTSRGSQKASLNQRTDGNDDVEKSSIKRAKRKINDNQATTNTDQTANKNDNKIKQERAKTEETVMRGMQNKVIKILLDPIMIGNESQEVAMIMKKTPNDVRDENLSIRESCNAKILQRESRNARGRKRPNIDSEVDSLSAQSSISSEIEDIDNESNNTALKAKRGRFAKNVVSRLQETQLSKKKETFKKPTRINQNSAHSILNSSTESLTDSQDSTESNILSSSRLSRSKVADMKKMEKIEVNQNTRRHRTDNSSSEISTNLEVTSIALTPSRTRRSMSVLSNSPSSWKHRILFTGITEDKYSKVVKMLGGNKVEHPAKCTVLVTDQVRRTYKFLCALASGIPIVSIDWLRDSQSAAQFLDWDNYILKDPIAEAKFGFRLRKSLDKAKKNKLLDGYTVVLTPGVAPPPVEEMKDMVTSCGGRVLLRPPTKWPEKAVIVSREEDLSNAKKFLAKAPERITVQSTEFILTGILRQETDFDKYKLI